MKRSGAQKTVAGFGSGFTLIELMLVMVILAVVAGLIIPNLGGSRESLLVKNAAYNLAYTMRYAQSRAVAELRPVWLLIDESWQGYRLAFGSERGGYAGRQDPLQTEPLPGRWGRYIRLPPGLRLSAADRSLQFYPDGSISRVRISVCARSRCLEVSTQEQRGYVHVMEAVSSDESDETETPTTP